MRSRSHFRTIEPLERRQLLANVLPAFADRIGLTTLVDPNTTFEDNFEGGSLDRSKWQVREGARWRAVPNGPTWNMSATSQESVVVRDGNLELIAYTDPDTGQHRSGWIQTSPSFKSNQPADVAAPRLASGYSGNFEQAFGYWEARIKFSSMPGQWSAFWVHSYGMVDIENDASRINRPDVYGTEFDVAENGAIRQGNAASGQISVVTNGNGYKSYRQANAAHPSTANYGPSYSSPDQYHVYGLLWTPQYAKFYIDGNLVFTETDPNMVSKVPHVAILSNEIGAPGALFENEGSNYWGQIPAGGYGSRETSNAKLTADYVRVWKLRENPPASQGVINGTVFNDTNRNGRRDAGESGRANVTVFIDKNMNGRLDGGEASRVSGADGTYRFETVALGNTPLSIVRPANTTGTAPPHGTHWIWALANQTYADRDFGVAENGTTPTPNPGPTPPTPPAGAAITGTVYHDINANRSRGDSEPGLANIQVYLDTNLNGRHDGGEPSTLTDSAGGYRFTQYTQDVVAVRVVLGNSYRQIAPVNNEANWVRTTEPASRTNRNFGLGITGAGLPPTPPTSNGTISGRVIADWNGNGRLDPNENGIGWFKVYLDYNGNGRLDGDEPSQISDLLGAYRFANVRAGSLAIRLDLTGRSNYIQTGPANNGAYWHTFNGTSITDRNFFVRL